MAEHLHRGAHALDVAVVVGTEDVDDQAAAFVLLVVVGDVGHEVGRLTVALEEHPVLLVAEVGGTQPGGAVLLVDEPGGAEIVDRLFHRPRVDERLLRGPPIEPHVHRLEHLALVGLGPFDPPRHRLGRARHLCRPLGDVVALVAVVGQLVTRRSGHERRAEQLGLHASVVHVELAVHGPSAAGEEPAQRVAVGRPAGVTGVERTGGIGRDVLDVDRPPGTDVGDREPVETGVDHIDENLVEPRVGEVEVHEPRPGDLHGAHVSRGRGREVIHQLLPQLAWVLARGLRRRERHVRRPVAVLGIGGTLQRDLGRHGVDPGGLQRLPQCGAQRIANIHEWWCLLGVGKRRSYRVARVLRVRNLRPM